jgi:RHS repeat-associated protein
MKIRIVSTLRRSRVMRMATAAAFAGQVLSATPVLAQDLTHATVLASAQLASDVATVVNNASKLTVRKGQRVLADAKRKITKARVHVNRTVPKVTPPNIDPMFGMNVSTTAITKARIFPEQLIPTSTPSDDDNTALARALERFVLAPAEQRSAIIDAHIQDRPYTPWRASLLVNVATLYAREGYFSRAAAYWDQAWELTRDSDDRQVKKIADYALGESIDQMVKFGQVAKLEARLKEAEGREVGAPAGSKVEDGWEGLRTLKHDHGTATFSGPEALKMYLTVHPIEHVEAAVRTIAAYHPSFEGTSMSELHKLAASVGLRLTMWHSSTIGQFPVQSIVHLRSQHFSAIVEYNDGKYRLRDPGLGGDLWVSESALRDETSGFVMTDTKPEGEWRETTDGEAASIVGHCNPGKPSNAPPPCPHCSDPPPGGPGGMPVYGIHPTSAALVIDDAPLGYAPPIGPDMSFRLSYNHRGKTPATFGYGNVGNLWTFNSLSYITDNGWLTVPPYDMTVVYLRGHGSESYAPQDTQNLISGATVVQISDNPANYERRLPDGTVEVYSLADRAYTLANRRIFLTSVTDPQGHTVEYTYDSSFRLVAVTDPLDQVTTFEYENASDPNLLTKVTDPFNREATLGYDGEGRLTSITDTAGMTSTFAYDTSDFIVSMSTPYGTTTFQHEPDASQSAQYRMLEITDPLGGKERMEYHLHNTQFASTVSSSEVPTGLSGANTQMDYYNSFFWDKLAMATHPRDYAYATNTSWMLGADAAYGHAMAQPIPHSVKKPLENRVWYRYPGQTEQTSSHLLYSLEMKPAVIARVVDGGASQITQMTYNSKGMITSRIDPVGRQTNYTYATNGIDLLTVEQVRSGGTDVIQAYSNYSNHLPATITDAAGQDTDFTYNTAGQPLTVTNAKNETTTYTYETGTNNLLTVTGPVSGATTTYTYDAYNRVESVEDADGYIVITDYDNLNRVTQRTYPDDTTEVNVYNRLDLTEQHDRLGRVTRHFYDSFGRRIATRDPAGRTIAQVWCDCGALDALVDANGNRTKWERDVQGRVTREIRADNTTDTLYTYDLAGRLKTITDPKDQVTTHSYNLDDSLSGTAYTDEDIETPDVSYTYETYYARMATMVDGIGTTSYTYKAAGTNGAGQVATIDGPLSNDTIAYTHDELGRMIQRTINGTANQVDWTFDALGRVTSEENLLGEFDYTYDGVTNRLSSVTYPNGQTSTYSYLNNAGDRRLQTIHHRYPNASTLSKFDYTYDVVGNILTWRQQADSTAVLWKYGHDLADQLTSAVKHATDTNETILQRFAYAYDPAGNRTVEQIDDAITLSAYDNLNRLTSQAPGGPMVIAGTLNEPGAVTISGKPAIVDANNNFRGTVPTTTGTNSFTIVARDATGNTTTEQYEVDISGSGKTFTYDTNGNVVTDGSRDFAWDARNQLVAIEVGDQRSELTYDGVRRRLRRTDLDANSVQRDLKGIWCGQRLCEERAANGSDVLNRRFNYGEQITGAARFVTADHLGNRTEVTDSSGAIVARYSFGPWGKRTLEQGTDVIEVGYTGHESLQIGSLWLTLYRAYDMESSRWLSEDPIGFAGGFNLYAYVLNGPINWSDPLGLKVQRCCRQVQLDANGRINRALQGIATTFGLRHCYLRTNSKKAGMGPHGGGPLPDNPLGLPTQVTDHSNENDPSEICQDVPDSDEECVNSLLEVGTPTGRWWPWNNCNGFANSVLNRCRKGPLPPYYLVK